MRIYTQTNNSGRLCIDNILLAEPMRASFDITGVCLLPAQPLTNDLVGVQATVGRFILNPQNIQLYLSYYAGTNNWGYANWRGRNVIPSTNCTTIPLLQSAPGSTAYIMPPGTSIPRGSIDDVVQYVVWGTFSNLVGRPMFQDTNTFSTPSWYYPIDRNLTNASGAYTPTSWSPYYYVFSCPPGSVWINEINYVADQLFELEMGWSELGWEYVELCGRVNTDISNWRIDVIDPFNNDSLYREAVVSTNTQIQAWYSPVDGKLQKDGWGFFTWGGSNVASLVPGPADGHGPTTQSPNIWYTRENIDGSLLLANAGLRLIRSMGAYEEQLCYGPSSINSELTARGFAYIGAKLTMPPFPAPLQLQGSGTNTADFYWYEPSAGNHSPGWPNTAQTLLPITPPYFTLISAISLHGAHNIGLSSLVAVQVTAGSTTSIVYTADSWYRISSFFSKGSAIQSASGSVQYTWAVTNLSQDCSNNVTFSMLSTNTNNVPNLWLAGFGHAEFDPYGNDALGVYQKYLLNLNPYASNAITFAVDDIGVTGATVHVSVKLLDSTNGVTYNAQQSIYGTLYLQGSTNLGGVWTYVASTQVAPPGVLFDVTGHKNFTFSGGTNKFYRATVQ